jgi:hypothetical protein
VRDRFGIAEPEAGADLMRPAGRNPDRDAAASEDPTQPSKIKQQRAKIKQGLGVSGGVGALQAEEAPVGQILGGGPEAALTARLEIEAEPGVAALMARVEAMLEAAGSLEEFGEMLRAGFRAEDARRMAEAMARGFTAAHAAGRIGAAEESAE